MTDEGIRVLLTQKAIGLNRDFEADNAEFERVVRCVTYKAIKLHHVFVARQKERNVRSQIVRKQRAKKQWLALGKSKSWWYNMDDFNSGLLPI